MFVTKPRSTQAFEGDTVIIYCEVIGDPKPDVVWLRDFLKVSLFIIAIDFLILYMKKVMFSRLIFHQLLEPTTFAL